MHGAAPSTGSPEQDDNDDDDLDDDDDHGHDVLASLIAVKGVPSSS